MNLNYVLTVKCSHELVDLLSDIGQLDEMVECRAIVGEVIGSISCFKVIRPSGSSLESVRLKWERVECTVGGSGGMLPGKFLNLASPKRTFRAFSERINEKMNEKLR